MIHDWEVNGSEASGFGWRCSCGFRNMGMRTGKESAAVHAIYRHLLADEENEMIEFGTKVRDTVTGFEGTVVARDEWWHTLSRLGIESSYLHEGKTIRFLLVDVLRVVVVFQVTAHYDVDL